MFIKPFRELLYFEESRRVGNFLDTIPMPIPGKSRIPDSAYSSDHLVKHYQRINAALSQVVEMETALELKKLKREVGAEASHPHLGNGFLDSWNERKESVNQDTREKDAKIMKLEGSYEEMRKKNIEERMSLLASLGIPLPTKKKSAYPSRKYTKFTKSEPVRKSRRLRNKLAEVSEVEERNGRVVSEPEEIKRRKADYPLDFASNLVTKSEVKPDLQRIFSFNDDDDNLGSRRVSDGLVDFTRESIKKYSLDANDCLKLVPSRIFCMAWSPSKTEILVAGDKSGRLGIINLSKKGPENEEENSFVYEPHTKPIGNCMFSRSDSSQLFTCSYDGTLKRNDLNKFMFSSVFTLPDEEGELCKYFDFFNMNDTGLLVTHQNGTLSRVDIREDTTSSSVFSLSSQSLRTVDVHPCERNYFAVSGSSKDVSIFDIRFLKEMSASNDDLCQPVVSLSHNAGTSCAFFSNFTGKKLVTVSMDDSIRIFDTSCLSERFVQLATTIPHNNHTGRWLTQFRACWHPMRDDCFMVGSMEHPRQVQVFSTAGSRLHTYRSENQSSIVSLLQYHNSGNCFVGGNSSGKVFFYRSQVNQ